MCFAGAATIDAVDGDVSRSSLAISERVAFLRIFGRGARAKWKKKRGQYAGSKVFCPSKQAASTASVRKEVVPHLLASAIDTHRSSEVRASHGFLNQSIRLVRMVGNDHRKRPQFQLSELLQLSLKRLSQLQLTQAASTHRATKFVLAARIWRESLVAMLK